MRNQVLEKGECVLIRAIVILGNYKLGDKWNSCLYLVVEKLPNLPVYHVKPEKGRVITKLLHCDHLPLHLSSCKIVYYQRESTVSPTCNQIIQPEAKNSVTKISQTKSVKMKCQRLEVRVMGS